jgi:hypothetical protein
MARQYVSQYIYSDAEKDGDLTPQQIKGRVAALRANGKWIQGPPDEEVSLQTNYMALLTIPDVGKTHLFHESGYSGTNSKFFFWIGFKCNSAGSRQFF